MTRRSYSGNAKATTLSSGINNSTLTIPVVSVTGYPAGGAAGPFLIVIDRGLATEEKILCDSISGSSFIANASGRGWATEGTAAATHNAGAIVEHVIGKVDVDEANAHVNDTTTDVHPQYVTTAEGATILSSANALVTFELPYTWAVGADVKVPSGDTDYLPGFFLPVLTGYSAKLTRCRYKINSGTSATVKVQLDGVDATGFTAISVVPTAATTNPTDVAVTDLQYVTLVVTAVSGSPKNMSFTLMIQFTRT